MTEAIIKISDGPDEYRGFRLAGFKVVETLRPVYEYGADGYLLLHEDGTPKISSYVPQTLVINTARPYSTLGVDIEEGFKVGAFVPVPDNPDAEMVRSAGEAVARMLTRKIDSVYEDA